MKCTVFSMALFFCIIVSLRSVHEKDRLSWMLDIFFLWSSEFAFVLCCLVCFNDYSQKNKQRNVASGNTINCHAIISVTCALLINCTWILINFETFFISQLLAGTLKAVIDLCVVGASVRDICTKSDNLMAEETSKVSWTGWSVSYCG